MVDKVKKKFRLLSSTHVENGMQYVSGDVIESTHDLDVMFLNKFERVMDAATKPVMGVELAKVSIKKVPVKKVEPEPEPELEKASEAENKPAIAGKDVTAKFKVAVDEDFLVYKNGAAANSYFVYDADTNECLNDKGLKRALVVKFIKDQLG